MYEDSWEAENLEYFESGEQLLQVCQNVRFNLEQEKSAEELYRLCSHIAFKAGSDELQKQLRRRFVLGWIDYCEKRGIIRALRKLKSKQIYSILIPDVKYADFVSSLDASPGFVTRQTLIDVGKVFLILLLCFATLFTGWICCILILRFAVCVRDAYRLNYSKLTAYSQHKEKLKTSSSSFQKLRTKNSSSSSPLHTLPLICENKQNCTVMINRSTSFDNCSPTPFYGQIPSHTQFNHTENRDSENIRKESWEIILNETIAYLTRGNKKDTVFQTFETNSATQSDSSLDLQENRSEKKENFHPLNEQLSEKRTHSDQNLADINNEEFKENSTRSNTRCSTASSQATYIDPNLFDGVPNFDSNECMTPEQYHSMSKVATIEVSCTEVTESPKYNK